MNVRQATRRTVLALAVVAAIAVTGCSKQQGNPQAAAARPVDVTVQTVATRPVQVNEEISGRTVAYRVAEVRPQVSGVLQKRLFTEGQYVKEGQPLYQIDAATYKAAEASAKAALNQAEAELALARVENLFPPIPSEVILTFAGFLTIDSKMTILGVIVKVLHGGSSNKDEEIALACLNGINKVNIASDYQKAFFDKLTETLDNYHPYWSPEVYCEAIENAKRTVIHKIELFGSAGKAVLYNNK